MSKITLNAVGSLTNVTTAENNIDNNFAVIQTAIDNTLSRDGTAPNTMEDTLDMNSNQIINLPSPSSNFSPVRVIDLANLATGGTINVSSLPVGGTTGQVLKKNSATNFDAGWETTHYLTAGGSAGQILTKNSGTDYDASWVSPSAAVTAGGAANSIQYNASGSFGGLSLTAGQIVTSAGSAPVAALPAFVNVVDAYGIDNTGVSNVASALQTAITNITTSSSVVYIPQGTYLLGNGSLSVPSYATIVCHPNAVLRRNSDVIPYADYQSAMVYMAGTRSVWIGGVLENTTVLATSTTSNTINGSNKTFTTQAGLPLIPGTSFVRIWSASHPEARFEGTVSAYSGTTLTLNSPFFGGSGTYSDWNIGFGHVFQAAMCLHASSFCTVEKTRIRGNWYVGLILEAYNPPSGGSLVCKNNMVRDCIAEAVQNRGFYLYGNCNDNTLQSCYASGLNIFPGATDYGFNFNPSSSGAAFNSQLRNKILGCTADSTGAQGFGGGDAMFYTIFSDCTASNMTQAASVGFLVQLANSGTPQYNSFENCVAHTCTNGYQVFGAFYQKINDCAAIACGTGYTVGPSGGNQSQYIHLGDCQAIGGTGNAFVIQGNTVRSDLIGCTAIANTGTGISIASGASIILIAGSRSFSNGTNYTDAGSGTVGTPTTS